MAQVRWGRVGVITAQRTGVAFKHARPHDHHQLPCPIPYPIAIYRTIFQYPTLLQHPTLLQYPNRNTLSY
jgi:hypothetical protein